MSRTGASFGCGLTGHKNWAPPPGWAHKVAPDHHMYLDCRKILHELRKDMQSSHTHKQQEEGLAPTVLEVGHTSLIPSRAEYSRCW